jgi:hypothetical protein
MIVVKNRRGETVFKRNVESKASGAGGFYDLNAVYNAFAKSIKENLYDFLNTSGNNLIVSDADKASEISIKAFFDDINPEGTGTGFTSIIMARSLRRPMLSASAYWLKLTTKGKRIPLILVRKVRC